MHLPGPVECAACGASPTRSQPAGPVDFARCSRCGHAAITRCDLAVESVAYDGGYAGFRPDPVFEGFVRRFLPAEILPRLPLDASVLDVGCGNATFLVAARDAGLRVLGWDVSEEAVQLARSRGLDAVSGDLDEVVPARSFDLVTMWDVIEHVPDPRALLRSAVRALRPGGRVLVKTPGVQPALIELCARVPRLSASLLAVPAHIQFFGATSLGAALTDAGLREEHSFAVGPTRAPTRGGGLGRELRRMVARELPRLLGCSPLLVLAREAA